MGAVKLAVAAVVLVLLAGCGGSHHKGEHCTHSTTLLIPMTRMVGKVPVTTFVPVTSCDHWTPNDASTVSRKP